MGWGGISSVNIPTGTLSFGNRVENYLMYLYGMIVVLELMVICIDIMVLIDTHFFSGGVERVNFDSLAAITCGGITANGTSYIGGKLTISPA